MNWKVFMAEYQLVQAWLEQLPSKTESAQFLLRVVVLILLGHEEPASIRQSALQPVRLTELLHMTVLASTADVRPVHHIDAIIRRWVEKLPRTDTILGLLYERISQDRRQRGQYYTPAEVVDYIIARTVAHLEIEQQPAGRVIDPACGCGFFLLKAYDCLRTLYEQQRRTLEQRFPAEDWSDEGIHLRIIEQHLYGIDIDPNAVEITAVSLLLKYPQAAGKAQLHIKAADSLQRTIMAANAEQEFPQEGYRCVIGNPPYVSFGLRGTGKLDAEYGQYLRQAYAATAEYKLSYYVFFLQRGIELLAPGGYLGFIVPDSFLLGRYYSKLRRFILEQTAIHSITHITAQLFKGAATGFSAICILEKQPTAQKRLAQWMKMYNIEHLEAFAANHQPCEYQQSYFAALPYQRFRMFFDLMAKRIVDQLDQQGRPLREFASGHTGIRSISRQCDIVATESRGASWQQGLVSGAQVTRYQLDYQGHWLNIDPSRLYKGGWRDDVVKRPKLLVRQTGFMLMACLDENGYYHLNNIHSFILRNDEISLSYLLLLFNSKLMSFYYHAVSMEYGRALAQTDIEMLETLPIMVHADINQQAPALVKTMMECADMPERQQAFSEYLDQVVYQIFGLAEAEIAYIEAYEEAQAAAFYKKARKWAKSVSS